MKVVCPCCATGFPIEAGLVEGDAKRLAKLCADMEPTVARAALSYLRLFKPAKQELRVQRAVLVLTDLVVLINSGRISKDDRTGMQRPCSAQHWVQGMEQMQTHMRLELPLKNHNYLRAIVFGLADVADAKAEVQREKDVKRRSGGSTFAKPDPLANRLAWARDLLSRGIFDQAKHDEEVNKAHALFGGGNLSGSHTPPETMPHVGEVKL